MAISIPAEYELIETLYESERTTVYRARIKDSGKPVVLKFLSQPHPSARDLVHFYREFDIACHLQGDEFASLVGTAPTIDHLLLVQEDIGAESLDRVLRTRRFDLEEFLDLAIQITEAVGHMHDQGVIHKDLNPSNIVWNPETGQLQIIDFGFSSRLEQEHIASSTTPEPSGTLPYLSPEQTGRTNRFLDYRTDFYSLGVVFYELLTGRRPFETDDPTEMVYSHLVRQPSLPVQSRGNIPRQVSKIIMKLMAKPPEDRYQSAHGLSVDLKECLRQFRTKKCIDEFELGRSDVRPKLRISHRLYGRDKELEQLQDSFQRACRGESLMTLVYGAAGVGKSSLVAELQSLAIINQAWFVRAKCEAHLRAVPFAGIRAALGQLVAQLLSLSDEDLGQWRRRAASSLGDDAALVIEVVPELEALVKDTPPAPRLEPAVARQRFQCALRRFIGLFCDDAHPLILILDDLHWADEASLEVVELLMTDEELSHILIVGAYRDNRVGPGHRLRTMISELTEVGKAVEFIELFPLNRQAACSLVAESVDSSPAQVRELCDVVESKTSGNPYFIGEFLALLARKKLLWFNVERGQWCWKIDEINALPVTDNVVDIVMEGLSALDAKTQDVLKYAAMLGTRFKLDDVASVVELPRQQTYARLEVAIKQGVLVAMGEPDAMGEPELREQDDSESVFLVSELAFSHDRLCEAALEIFEEKDRAAAHLRVGRLLKPKLPEDESSPMLFSIVEHLNSGIALIDNPEERLELAKMSLRAAQRALKGQAFTHAAQLLTQAQGIFGDKIWSEHRELAKELYLCRGRTESLLGHFNVAEGLANQALTELVDPLERVDFICLLIEQHTHQGNYEKAVEAGRKGLAALDIQLERTGFQKAAGRELSNIEQRLGERSIKEIASIPVVEDRCADAALRILSVMLVPAGLIDLLLLLLVGLKGAAITLEVGIRRESSIGLSSYAQALCILNARERGYEAGKLAIDAARRLGGDKELAQTAFNFGAVVMPWTRHLRESEPLLAETYRAAMRSGEHVFSGLSLFFQMLHRFWLGRNLEGLLDKATQVVEFAREGQNRIVIDGGTAYELILRNLLGKTPSAREFSNAEFDSGEAFLRSCEEHHNLAAASKFQMARAQVFYLYGDSRRALKEFDRLEANIDQLLGTFDVGLYPFYRALALADVITSTTGRERDDALAELKELRLNLADFADTGPPNFEHKLCLVDAEIARLDGGLEEAMNLYDQAIKEARYHDFLHVEALANERAALFWLDRGKENFAGVYLREARYAYDIWGAHRKVGMLDKQYWRFFSGEGSVDSSSDSESSSGDAVDVASVFKASELIASQINIDELLPILMQVTLENAGAQRGAFVVAENHGLYVAVTGELDTEPTTMDPHIPIDEWSDGPSSIVRYVYRTGKPLVLGRAFRDARFRGDPFIKYNRIRSVICIPAVEHGEMIGVLYAENNLGDEAFTEERTRILQILVDHIAISLNKARLYHDLHEREEHFRQLAENIHEVFWSMDWPSKKIVYVSPAYETVWGRPLPTESKTVDEWVESIHENDRERIASALRDKTATGSYDESYRVQRPSGAQRWIRDRGFPISDRDGNIYRIAGVAMDITREHEVARLKDEFISVVSHELRTPLTPITGVFSMLAGDYADELPEAVQRMVELGLRNSRRLLRLIDDLLDIQKLSMRKVDFELEILDLRELVTEALKLSEPLGQMRDIAFELVEGTDSVVIETDRSRLLQVFTNLISNAVKFSDRNAVIDIEVRRIGNRARVAVTDHGPGIAPEAKTRIFEKFTQGDASLTRKHGGTGLGLAIASSIVERLHGRLYLESELGGGSTFYVELPLVG